MAKSEVLKVGEETGCRELGAVAAMLNEVIRQSTSRRQRTGGLLSHFLGRHNPINAGDPKVTAILA